jgi:hypothetical protein
MKGQIINEGAKLSKKCKIVENARDIKLKTIVENGIIGKFLKTPSKFFRNTCRQEFWASYTETFLNKSGKM